MVNRNLRIAIIAALAIAAAIFAYHAIFMRSNDNKMSVTGFDRSDMTAANARWAIFEEWVKARPQYKGWESDPEIFKKANEEFINKTNTNVTVIK